MADESVGVDASTLGDLDPTFAPIRGARVVLERIVRRWITARGDLEYAPDDGADLLSWVNEGSTQQGRRMLATFLLVESKKDEAVLDATIALNFDGSSHALAISATVSTDDGPFEFTVAISSLGVELLRTRT